MTPLLDPQLQAERLKRILILRENGLQPIEIGKRIGLSSSRINQLLKFKDKERIKKKKSTLLYHRVPKQIRDYVYFENKKAYLSQHGKEKALRLGIKLSTLSFIDEVGG